MVDGMTTLFDYTYDNAGNRTGEYVDGQGWIYADFSSVNQLIDHEDATPSVLRTFDWDDNGGLLDDSARE